MWGMKKKVILSFDYELFFGDCSGTVQKTLIEPTNQLLDAMDSVGFKGNFFVDWQMLKYLKEQNTERTDADYELIVAQLKDMIRRGHRVELHIHPHWVDAKYNGDGTWDYSEFRHYSLSTFTEEEIVCMFKEGANLLTNIARQVEPDYILVAFRAGGWAVQPFENIGKGLKAAGIHIDSSVLPSVRVVCDHSECNFFDAHVKKEGMYLFQNDVCKEDPNGEFLEIPISRTPAGILRRIAGKLFKKSKYDFTSPTDGTHIRTTDNPDKWEMKGPGALCTFSYVVPICVPLFRLEDKRDVLCFIDHPKDIHKYTCKSIKLLSYVASTVLYKDYVDYGKKV